MAAIKPVYPATSQDADITLTTLASSATVGRESAVYSNESARHSYIDVRLSVTTALGTAADSKAVYLWLVPSVPNSAGTYVLAGNGAGVDAALTGQEGNFQFLGAVAVTAQTTAFSKVFRIYNPPARFSFYVRNHSGMALSGVAAENKIAMTGYYDEVV